MTRHPAARLTAPLLRARWHESSAHQRDWQGAGCTGRVEPLAGCQNRACKLVFSQRAGLVRLPFGRSRLAFVALAALATLTSTSAVAASGAQDVQYNAAIASLPPTAGRVIAVQQSGGGSNFRQRIILSGGNAGANAIEIATGRSATMPSAGQISAELAAQFPGVVMTPLPARVLNNAYGPMHIAIGAPTAGGRCVYVWQQVRDLPGDLPGASGQGPRLFQRANPGSIRIRLCSASATLDELAGMSEQLVIGAPASHAAGGALPQRPGARALDAQDPDIHSAAIQSRSHQARSYADAERPSADVRLTALPEDISPEPHMAQQPSEPRIMLAQASGRSRGGALLDRSSGNPGGLIGMLRGYKRSDPIGVTRSRSGRTQFSRSPSSRQSRAGFGERPLLDDGPGGSARGGLLGRWSGRNSVDDQRYAQPTPRARRAAPAQSYRAPAPRRPAAQPRRAAPRKAVPQQAVPRQASPQRAMPQPVQPRQIQQQNPVNQRPAPQGFQAPGGGARYLGQAPGTAPTGAAPTSAGGVNQAIPQVPRPVPSGNSGVGTGAAMPVTGAPGSVTPPRPAEARPGSAGSQPRSMGSQPVLRGLDPTLPGRAYRGPGG